MENIHEKFMQSALKEAEKALLIDEVPIGCVIVKDGKILARGHNKKETTKDPCGHAEILTIKKACKKLDNWRLEDCDIYVTIEPCIMCSGAIIQSRIRNVYYGAPDLKGGGFGSSINVLESSGLNHYPNVYSNILGDKCAKIISDYFKTKRNK